MLTSALYVCGSLTQNVNEKCHLALCASVFERLGVLF